MLNICPKSELRWISMAASVYSHVDVRAVPMVTLLGAFQAAPWEPRLPLDPSHGSPRHRSVLGRCLDISQPRNFNQSLPHCRITLVVLKMTTSDSIVFGSLVSVSETDIVAMTLWCRAVSAEDIR